MAREQGTFNFSANFETLIEGTLDARQMVDNFSDLLNFTSDNFIKNGFFVAVSGEVNPSEKGLYFCNNSSNLDLSTSWTKLSSTADLFSGSYIDLTDKPNLFSGNYNDLTNKPILFDGQYSSLTGIPNFATVATSGNYNDLSNKPDLSAISGNIIETTFNNFPTTGSQDNVYIAEDTGYMYRWNGTGYTQLTDQTAIWGQIGGTLSNQTDLQDALNGKSDNGHTHPQYSTTDSYVDGAGFSGGTLSLSRNNGLPNVTVDVTTDLDGRYVRTDSTNQNIGGTKTFTQNTIFNQGIDVGYTSFSTISNASNANDFKNFIQSADSIFVDSNSTGTTNYPSEFGHFIMTRGSTDNRSMALWKANGNNSDFYLGNYNSTSSNWEWSEIWHSRNLRSNSQNDGRYVDLFNTQTIIGSKTFEGTTRFIDNAQLRIGSSGNGTLKFQSNGNDTLADMTGDVIFRDGNSSFVERVRITTEGIEDNRTQLGKTSTPYEIIGTADWKGVVGKSRFIQSSSTGNSVGSGYWFVTGRRDTFNGYGGILINHTSGEMFTGVNATGGNPSWRKVWDSSNLRSNSDNDGRYVLKTSDKMSGKLEIQVSNNSDAFHVRADSSLFRLKTNVETNQAFNSIFRTGLYYSATENASIVYYRGGNTTGGELGFTTNDGTERMRIDKDGNVGIGINPSEKLEVNGNIKASGDVIAFASSDKNLKENIVNIDNPVNKLKKLNGVYFDWIESDERHSYSGKDIGVIAQEVESILPEIVTTRKNGVKAVQYHKLIPLTIEAIKEQDNKIEKQQSQLNSLQEQIDELKKLIK